jgi:hypothetical protein
MEFNIRTYIFTFPDVGLVAVEHDELDSPAEADVDFFDRDDDNEESNVGTGSTTDLMMREFKCFSSFYPGVIFMSKLLLDLCLV